MVVETMKKEHLSIYAAMQEFGINDHKIIERWERIYLEEGPEGLSVERRGRGRLCRPQALCGAVRRGSHCSAAGGGGGHQPVAAPEPVCPYP